MFTRVMQRSALIVITFAYVRTVGNQMTNCCHITTRRCAAQLKQQACLRAGGILRPICVGRITNRNVHIPIH